MLCVRSRGRSRLRHIESATGMPIKGLSRQQEATLAVICEIGGDQLRHLARTIDETPFTIDRSKITGLVTSHVGSDAGEKLVNFLFGIVVNARQDPEAPLEVLSRLDARIVKSDDPAFAAWPACYQALLSLVQSPSLRLSAKALEVAYDFERIYREGRFITSARPVFNDGRDAIMGAIVVQTLRLDYSSSTGEESTLSVAMDMADIKQLRRACDDAIKKGETAFKAAADMWNVSTLMPGEDRQ